MKKLYLIFIVLLLSVSAFCKEMTFSVLDVGQGLCCVIISPDRHCMVFDCGTQGSRKNPVNKSPFSNVLDPYLKENAIKKIDYLCLSHPNTDHYSGFPELVKKYPIGKYIKNGFKSDTPAYNELMKTLAKKNLSAQVARAGQTFMLGSDVKCTVLSPIHNYETKNDNDQSLIIRVQYKKTSFLLMGDASSKAEREAVKKYGRGLASTVLLAAHHGSNSSSCYDFLIKVSPKAAIISCGFNNRYGHPHQEVLKRLKQIRCNIYRTDLMGAIVCRSDGNRITVSKSKRKSKKNKFVL